MTLRRSVRGWVLATGLALAAGVAGCAKPAPVPVLVPGMERYPEYPRPEVPPDLARARQATQSHDRAWVQLQLGDPASADRAFRAVLQRTPAFYPSHAGLGFTRLALDDDLGALDAFDRALARRTDYLPALVGRAEALLELGREGEAYAAYRAILAVAPDHPVAARRVEVLRLRALQADVAAGRQALTAGDYALAREALQRAVDASPESAFLHRDLARVALALDEDAEARARIARALELDPQDADAWALQGRLRARAGDLEAAVADLRQAVRLNPDLTGVPEEIAALEARIADAALPAEFKAIATHTTATRGDLAALLAHHVPALLDPRRPTVLITDARRHWAQPAILQVIRAGVMTEYANHTFQPEAAVTRGDLAATVDRVLGLVARRAPAAAREWRDARLTFSDLRPAHVLYQPASRAVASGVLRPVEGQRFGARLRVTGAEAMSAIERLAQVVARAGLDVGGTRTRP